MAAFFSLSPIVSRFSLPLGIGLLSYASAMARGDALLADPDVYLHIAVGRTILVEKFVPHSDIFSYSVHGSPWIVHEWLSEIIFAFIYDQFGWVGLFAIVAASFAIAMALLADALLKFIAPVYAVIGTVTAWGLCFPSLVVRPHALTLPIVVAWVSLLVRARSADKAPHPLTALLMLLWANLHGSFIIGLVLAALFAGEALLNASNYYSVRRIITGWSVFGALSIAAAVLTPNGVAGVLLPFKLAGMNLALSLMSEWRSPNFQHPQPFEIWVMLLLFGTLLKGIKLPVERIVILLVFIHMALLHQRHIMLLGLVTPLLFAPSVGWQLPREPEKILRLWLKSYPKEQLPSAAPRVMAIVTTLFIAVGATVWPRDIHGAARFTPALALATVQHDQIRGPVLNDLNFGGFLIFSGIPTFIDGRVDVYGDDFIRRYLRAEQLPELLAQYQVSWTILGAGHPDIALLDHLPGWRRFYADSTAVVHVRETKDQAE